MGSPLLSSRGSYSEPGLDLGRPHLSPMDRQRPLSIAELTSRSKPTGYNPKKSFRTSLRIALDEIKAGRAAKDEEDIEQAFIRFSKAHTLLTEELPSHPRYPELEPQAQDAVIWRGHEVEIWLNETKALVGRRILDWKLRHLNAPSTPRTRVQSESGIAPVIDLAHRQLQAEMIVTNLTGLCQIVVRQPTAISQQPDHSNSPDPTEVSANPTLSSSTLGTPAVPALTDEPSPSQSTIDESASVVTPSDVTAFPAVQGYDGASGSLNSNSTNKTRPRTLSETLPARDRPPREPPQRKLYTSPGQDPNAFPPKVNENPTTASTSSVFYTAPLALEMVLLESMDVASDPEHPESIAKLEEEAVSFLELQQFERATNVLTEVLKLRRRIQGDSHLFTIQTMSNLGLGYEGQGKLDQAVVVLLETLKCLERSHSAVNLRFRSPIEARLAQLREKQEEARKMMTVVPFSSLKRGAKRNNSIDQIATRVRFDENLPAFHIDLNTTPEAIMAHLTNRRCPNLTDMIDRKRCSKVPVNRGGYGDIWQGMLIDGRPIAMKRIYQGERKINKRLAQELYAWSKTNHENVLELWGIAYYMDYLVMISPWMSYGSIHDYLEQYPDTNRLHMAIQVTDGIAHLHRIGMVHGDLKAQNVFVSQDGVLKVADFGLAVMLGERSVAFQPSSAGANLSAAGTVRWMAPELYRASISVSLESDIYSLGMTIYKSRRWANVDQYYGIYYVDAGTITQDNDQPLDRCFERCTKLQATKSKPRDTFHRWSNIFWFNAIALELQVVDRIAFYTQTSFLVPSNLALIAMHPSFRLHLSTQFLYPALPTDTKPSRLPLTITHAKIGVGGGTHVYPRLSYGPYLSYIGVMHWRRGMGASKGSSSFRWHQRWLRILYLPMVSFIHFSIFIIFFSEISPGRGLTCGRLLVLQYVLRRQIRALALTHKFLDGVLELGGLHLGTRLVAVQPDLLTHIGGLKIRIIMGGYFLCMRTFSSIYRALAHPLPQEPNDRTPISFAAHTIVFPNLPLKYKFESLLGLPNTIRKGSINLGAAPATAVAWHCTPGSSSTSGPGVLVARIPRFNSPSTGFPAKRCGPVGLYSVRYFHRALIHLLYKDIYLEHTKSTGLFCRTMVEGRPELRAFPKSITVCTPLSHMKEINTPLANSIRAALELTPNLVDLTLSVTSSNFATIFKGSEYPFMLRRLTAPLHASAGFADFLNAQQQLEEFNVLPAARGLLVQRIRPDAFPELQILSCNFQTLTHLVPSRPLSRIGCTKLLTNEFEAFGELMTRSAAPITSVDVILVRPRSSMLGVVQAFLQCLEGISATLEHLSITLSFPLDFVSKHNSIYARLKQRRSTFEGFSELRTAVSNFGRIRSFSLEHERCVNDVPPEFCRSVVELSQFTVWKQSSPTLESLSVFGVSHSW
ncbi:hypothetical protein OPQ81_000696 [Rhizoctonia solani]|nr:hypothetical protein OPQ81_000696 [Rhizoctonia solani]